MEAADQAGISLQPPKTWEDLDSLAKFFNGRDWDGDGKVDHGIALALAADREGSGNDLHLARAASLGQHKDQYSFFFDSDSMAPRIDTPPFVEALTGLIALKDCGPPGMETFDAIAAWPRVRGRQGCTLDRPGRAVRSLGEREACRCRAFARLGTRLRPRTPTLGNVVDPQPAQLPPSGRRLAGRYIGAAAQGTKRDAAIDFAKYLTSPDAANQVRSNPGMPMLPVRNTLLGQGPSNSNGVDARQWSEAVGRTLAAVRVVPGLRIPEANGYLSDLTAGRLAALKGEPAEQALHTVSQAWQARTQRLGTARGRWHYQRTPHLS